MGSASQRRLVQRQRFRHWLYKSYDAVFLLKKIKRKGELNTFESLTQ
jgi:hypothetical protein